MNENVKKYLTYGGYIVLVIAVASFVWLLFRDNRTSTDTDHRAVQCIEQTAAQQRKAEAEISSINKKPFQDGINRGNRGTGQPCFLFLIQEVLQRTRFYRP